MSLSCTAVTPPEGAVTRAELLERYRALPLPTTSEESWRFTDLSGFDPDAFVANGRLRGEAADATV